MTRTIFKSLIKRKSLILLSSLILLFALVYYLSSRNGEIHDDELIAIVNGETILLKDLEEKMSMIRINYPPDKGVSLKDIKHTLINRMIVESLALQDAKQKGISVSRKELDIAEKGIRSAYTDEEFEQTLISLFISYDDWRSSLEKRLTVEKLLSKEVIGRINISDVETLERYESNYKGKKTKPAVRIAQLFTSSRDKAQKALSELREDAKFYDVVTKYSESPEAENNGLLGVFRENEGPEVFDKAFDMEEDEISGILRSDFGYHIIKLMEKIPASEMTYEQAKPKIVSQMVAEQESKYYKEWLERRFKESKILKNTQLIDSIR